MVRLVITAVNVFTLTESHRLTLDSRDFPMARPLQVSFAAPAPAPDSTTPRFKRWTHPPARTR
jgi:hypothetical protein